SLNSSNGWRVRAGSSPRWRPLVAIDHFQVADQWLEAYERYLRRYTTVVSVSAGSGAGSPYISHDWPADSLRLAPSISGSRRPPRLCGCTVRAAGTPPGGTSRRTAASLRA